MKKVLTAATSAFMFLLVASGANAQDEDGAEVPVRPVESWTCNYLDGKGPDDLDAVVDDLEMAD